MKNSQPKETAEKILNTYKEWNYGQYRTADVIDAMQAYASQQTQSNDTIISEQKTAIERYDGHLTSALALYHEQLDISAEKEKEVERLKEDLLKIFVRLNAGDYISASDIAKKYTDNPTKP